MIAHYVQLDSDSVSDSLATDAKNSKTITKLKILASILSIIAAALTVSLVVVVVHGTPLPPTIATSAEVSTPSNGWTTASATTPVAHPTTGKICVKPECVIAAGNLASSMDTDANPCDDFYKFTCGRYNNDHPLPQNADGWSHFYKLTYEVRNNLRAKLDMSYEDWQKSYDSSTDPKSFDKLFNFYHGCKNESARNANGYSGLLDGLKKIGGWPLIDPKWDEVEVNYDWEQAIINSIKMKHFPLIKMVVTNDLIHANRSIIDMGPNPSFMQGLTRDGFRQSPNSRIYNYLPTHSHYYMESTDGWDGLGGQIVEVITKIKKLNKDVIIKNPQFKKDMDDLHLLLNNLKSNKTSGFDSQDFMDYYDNFTCTVSELDLKFPGINWSRILLSSSNDIKNETLVFVPDLKFFNALPKIMNTTNKRTIANYIGASFVLNLGQYTTKDLIETLVTKLDAPEVLPNVCYELTETLMPNLLGRFYVDKFFNKNSTEDMEDLIKRIHDSFMQTLNSSETDWMDSRTKAEAIMKVENIKKNVAYPHWTADNKVLDAYYENVKINGQDFLSSVLSVLQNNQKQNLLLLRVNDVRDHPTDPDISIEWAKDSWPLAVKQDATYVNAFYYFSTNGIYFPAGIAQVPFYQLNRPMAINLGSIGMIIGHEMTHSLDNSGSLYDYQGDLRQWWKPQTRQSFENKSQCFVDQYSSIPDYKQQFNLTVNGSLTLRENIADNGGIRQAYRALKDYQKERSQRNENFEPLPEPMNKYTEEQLFFISFASMWCSNMEPNAIRNTLLYGDHPPERVRVTQALANFDKFSEAFACAPGSKMNPKEKCKLW